MVKIGLVSDLHTEFWKPSDYLTIGPRVQASLEDADLILLAGDIGVGIASYNIARRLFPDRPVFMVAGNHEFYGDDYETVLGALQATTGSVMFLHNTVEVLTIRGTPIRIVGTTLWTDFALHQSVPLSILDAMLINDYHLIRFKNQKLKPHDTLKWHEEQLSWLLATLDKQFEGITIVMTHHAPVSFAIAPEHIGSNVAPCFASSLENYLLRDDLPLVVWGHTHHCVDRVIDRTHFVSNQTGYPGWVSGGGLTETGQFGQIIEVA
jgi:predicted phosphodiesterase